MEPFPFQNDHRIRTIVANYHIPVSRFQSTSHIPTDFQNPTMPTKVMTMQGLIRDWNSNISEMEAVVTEANEEIMRQIDAGTMSLEAGVAAWNPLPKKLAMPNARWARWFLKEWGWSFLSRNSDSQTWLPYSHVDMEAMRQRIRRLIEDSKVHGALLLNFDQLWRSCYQWNWTLLYKQRKHTCKRVPRQKAPKRADKKLHTIKGARKGITDSWMASDVAAFNFLSHVVKRNHLKSALVIIIFKKKTCPTLERDMLAMLLGYCAKQKMPRPVPQEKTNRTRTG